MPLHYDTFIGELQKRMAKGHAEYKGRSYSKAPEQLLDEIMEEALDIAGWASILYARLYAMKVALRDESSK